MTTKSGEKPGTEPKEKRELVMLKIILQLIQNKWNLRDVSFLEQMSSKMSPNKKQLNTMAAVAATKEPEYFDEEGNKKNQQCAYYHSGQGFSLPVWHSWRKKD